jgi:signal transduction histidine kinase
VNRVKLEFTNSRDEGKGEGEKQGNSPAIIEADKGRISQVVSNLLANAVKFTNEGTVKVATEKKDNEIVISIKDTGAGIDSEILLRLFGFSIIGNNSVVYPSLRNTITKMYKYYTVL